ncbi:MAG: AAA family ATPase [Desulfovermiculus sp.]|nr:AAA family ATPase [Desulfovermiculus sp.]
MPVKYPHPDSVVDAEADETIERCVTASPPRSFFLFAGAGSGKTRSLIKALQIIKTEVAERFRLHGRQVGVITFTNKACDEIKRRLEYDPLFAVSTIHSFAWSLISGLNSDIREWLRENLKVEIAELEEKERKGRTGTKASRDRQAAIASKNERLTSLDGIKSFIYRPDGDNPERNALNHAEVIKITSGFLAGKPLMQKMLVNRFPILLVDESQDTDKPLMEALLFTEVKQRGAFSLGIIGDMMQRIYTAGKLDLGSNLPEGWATPEKVMNHRSGLRIVKLINKIREPIDGQSQRHRADRNEGFVRLFIVPTEVGDKPAQEYTVCQRMAELTGDDGWKQPGENVKTLILEHHMAAKRLGFLAMWQALHGVSHLQTGLRDGSLPPLRFFSQIILPLIRGHQQGDRFGVAAVVRNESPFLDRRGMKTSGSDQMAQVAAAKKGVDALVKLWHDGRSPTFLDVLSCVRDTRLFSIPEAIRAFSVSGEDESEKETPSKGYEADEIAAWRSFLETPFAQIEPYSQYIEGEAAYDTHQGIKGLEFPRVCVIMDDSEARGFMFSYEKLLGAKAESSRSDPMKETSIDRTRRLFYVTCSRAEDSLALIAYSEDPLLLREHALNEEWFEESEIEMCSL